MRREQGSSRWNEIDQVDNGGLPTMKKNNKHLGRE